MTARTATSRAPAHCACAQQRADACWLAPAELCAIRMVNSSDGWLGVLPRLPYLIAGDVEIGESVAIMYYLLNQYGTSHLYRVSMR